MSSVIEVVGLRKEYQNLRRQRTVALDGIDFTIPGPGVYGLLGPNGSGKTTTIRCLLGLVRPTAGTVRVLGAGIADIGSVIGRVGALVEGPKFTPNMSGRANLELFGSMSSLGAERVDAVLELVEMSDRAGDLVGTYSLGMSQRLGIAAAMLNDPELVILDEPGNGLDPAGMADIRRLVRRLADEGRTVLISSHQLHEIQQVCDRVVIFQAGKVIANGTVADIVGATGQRIVISIQERAQALSVLTAAGHDPMPGPADHQISVQLAEPATPGMLNRLLAENGLFADTIAADAISLEAAFLSLTGVPAPPPPAMNNTNIHFSKELS